SGFASRYPRCSWSAAWASSRCTPTTSGCPGCAGTGSRPRTIATWAGPRTELARGATLRNPPLMGGLPAPPCPPGPLAPIEFHQLAGRLGDAPGQGRVDGERGRQLLGG